MKISLSLLSLIILSFSNQTFAKSLALSSEQGSYALDSANSDFYCSNIPFLELLVNGTEVQIILADKEKIVRQETIPGVNTSHYTQYSGLTEVIYTRHVFKQGKLKRQRSVWAFGYIPDFYKDDRVVLEMLNEGKLIYNFDSYGSSYCNFIRID